MFNNLFISMNSFCFVQHYNWSRGQLSRHPLGAQQLKKLMNSTLVNISEGIWYYFTVDLNFKGYASFEFIRYIMTNDREAALIKFLDKDYFSTRDLLLLPYSTKKSYFNSRPTDILSVWTFDGSKLGSAQIIDLKSQWPNNILDKAAITPSEETAINWTKNY